MVILPFIVKLVVSCGLLYGYYHFFLRNKRFHHYNRFYLLAAAFLSVIIPFLNIPVHLFGGSQQHSALIQTLRVINANGWEEPVTIYARQNQWSNWINLQNSLYFVYIAGLVTGLIILFRSLAWISTLKRKYPHETIDRLKIYATAEPGTPFSFFRSIFWDENISLNDQHGQQIFRHEVFHVKEKHSADVLAMEIICCICWFNPFFHLIKKEIKAIHEFLADEYAASSNNRYEYAELLLARAISQKTAQLTHPFFHNQIKRRITMITQSNLIRRSGYISRIMALPLLFVLVSAFAVRLTSKPGTSSGNHYAGKTLTVVIDAGHGGIYPGAHSANLSEKNITLDLAQKIKEVSGDYNLNIILTRNNDALVGNATGLREDLLNRAKIAADAKADLFISIHANVTTEQTTSRTGFDAYISGRNENPHDKMLASTILTTLKEIYPINEIIQQRDMGVQVLDHKPCPGVLLECGYMNNPGDLAFITNKDNQEKIARKILEGIVKYSNAQTTYSQESVSSDTLSDDALNTINMDAIKSLDADLHANLVTIHFKNGTVKYAHALAMNKYLAASNTDTVPTGHGAANKIFTKVEFEPDYAGGEKGWIDYLIKNVHYPKDAIAKKLQGTVVVEFIVDTTGKISDVKAISGPKELQAESIRVVKESGSWTSAMNNGRKVKAYKRQPINYKLSS